MSLIALLLASQIAASTPPDPTPRPVTDTRFGITLEDPDRWLEDQQNPAARDWIRGQAEHSRALLDSIPGRAAVLADIERFEAMTGSTLADVVLMRGERLLLRRKEAGGETARLYLREGWDGPERLVLDPEDWKQKTGKPHSINYAVPSPDGRLAIVGLSESGSEMATAHIVDLASGAMRDAPITRVRFGISWLPDGSGFFYNRQVELAPGQPEAARQLNSQAWLHLIGQDIARDALVFGNAYDDSLGIDPAQLPAVVATAGSAHLLAFPFSVDNRLTVFAAPLADLGADRIRWRKVVSPDDAVRSVVLRGDDLYLLTASEPNRRIERFPLADQTRRRSVVVPSGLLPIDDISGTNDALYYVAKRDSGVGSQLYRLPWGAARASAIELEGLDSVFPYSTQDGVDGLVVAGTGWASFPTVRRIDAAGRVHATNLQPAPNGVDASRLVSTIVQVPGHDGVEIPLSIVHRDDLRRDGSNPTSLQAYGAYGLSTNPALIPAHFAFFERGFVRAFCHVRGGGEKGEAWYRAGFQATKSNTWKDLIACAEYLVREKYTSPARLGATGGSAGGIMIGNAMLERPDLFGAMVPQVGVLDSVGAALRDPNGPVNWPEFGDPNTEAGFKALVGMSAYHKVRDGTRFPPVLLMHGYNDPRVAVWHSAKMAARLQRANAGDAPVLLDIDYDAGHGVGSAQSSVNAQRADIISFMLWQFGVEGFAPAR